MGQNRFILMFQLVSIPFAEEGEYFLKVLIPSYAAGSIIGKGGQTIVQLQKETGATIKLSKSKDFYPGRYPLSTVVLSVPGFAAGATQHDLFLVLRMQDNEFLVQIRNWPIILGIVM